MKQAAALFRAAFPDWRSTVHDLIAEDAKVVERFTTWGTHEGEFMSIPRERPAGRDGRDQHLQTRARPNCERWRVLDQAGLTQQLRGER